MNMIKKVFFNEEQNLILEYFKKPVLEFTTQQEIDYFDENNKSIRKSNKKENVSTKLNGRNFTKKNLIESFQIILNDESKNFVKQDLIMNSKFSNLLSSNIN